MRTNLNYFFGKLLQNNLKFAPFYSKKASKNKNKAYAWHKLFVFVIKLFFQAHKTFRFNIFA